MKDYDAYMKNIRGKAEKMRRRRRMTISAVASVLALAVIASVLLSGIFARPNREHGASLEHPTTGNIATGANTPSQGDNGTPDAPTTGANTPSQGVVLDDGFLQHTTARDDYAWLLEHLYAPVYDVDYGVATPDGAPGDNTGAVPEVSGSESYVEVTDNQVTGIVEGDLFKRSDKYLYFLHGYTLRVYSIAGESSALVGEIDLTQQLTGGESWYTSKREMYLSADCKSVTILATKSIDRCLVLLSLDVSEPSNISVAARKEFSGVSFSSRMVGDTLLLSYYYSIYEEDALETPDEPTRYVPSYGSEGNMQPMDACNIYCPSNEVTNSYAVFAKVDATTLEVEDMTALLGYMNMIYVSDSTIYATRRCYGERIYEDGRSDVYQTAVTGIGYDESGLRLEGTIVLDGIVSDQYYLDEYEGVLRVVTTTMETKYRILESGRYGYAGVEYNCSLYCVDLSDWTICASVIAFAPAGDEVFSVRFDGVNAYICTAERAQFSDPVYFFDLSDLENIRYKQTPIIDGYSSSLIRFGDRLIGIGIDSERTLKIEVYVETEDGAESVDVYVRNGYSSDDYKSYYIDREKGILGIPVVDYGEKNMPRYLLLQLRDDRLEVLHEIDLQWWNLAYTRATVIDGYLYLLEDELHVLPLA